MNIKTKLIKMKNLKSNLITGTIAVCTYLILSYVDWSFLPDLNDFRSLWAKLPNWIKITYQVIFYLYIICFSIILLLKMRNKYKIQ